MSAWGTLRRVTGHRCEWCISHCSDLAREGSVPGSRGGGRVLDVHGLLVGDDLDPALDLRNISVSSGFVTVGALTSGILAALQSAAIQRMWVGRLRDFRRVVRAESTFGWSWLDALVWRSGTRALSLAPQSSSSARAESTADKGESGGPKFCQGEVAVMGDSRSRGAPRVRQLVP